MRLLLIALSAAVLAACGPPARQMIDEAREVADICMAKDDFQKCLEVCETITTAWACNERAREINKQRYLASNGVEK